MRTLVAAPGLGCVALLVRGRGQRDAALHDISSGCVLVLRRLARILALNRVSPVRPRAVREVPERCHPEVVARERHGTVVELLVVRIRTLARIRELGLVRPTQPAVSRLRAEHCERRRRRAVGAVADRQRNAVARVETAVPPDCMEGSAVGRDVGKHLVTRGLVVDEGWPDVRPVRPVVADEVGGGLAARVGLRRVVRRARRGLRARLRGVVDDVNPLARPVELVGRRANLRVTPEEREAGSARIGEVAAVTCSRGAGFGSSLVLEARIVGL